MYDNSDITNKINDGLKYGLFICNEAWLSKCREV